MDASLLIKQNLNSFKSLSYPKRKKEILELLIKTVELIQGAQELSPRRQEILLITKDHQTVSADFLYRRFVTTSPRLLRYDLKFLIDRGYIFKIGKTRGALYSPVVR